MLVSSSEEEAEDVSSWDEDEPEDDARGPKGEDDSGSRRVGVEDDPEEDCDWVWSGDRYMSAITLGWYIN